MSTLAAKPIKVRKLNTKLLPIAAIVLLVLALLFMATPLLRSSTAFTPRSGNLPQFNGQTMPDPGNRTFNPDGQNGFPSLDNVPEGQVLPGQGGSNFPTRRVGGQGGGLLGSGFLSGITGTIVYALALLISLAAAVGMFLNKRWGQVLGIVMAVIYLLLALVSFLPMILLGFLGGINSLSLGLGLLQLVLAMAVIVLALIPAKKEIAPVVAASPPEASG